MCALEELSDILSCAGQWTPPHPKITPSPFLVGIIVISDVLSINVLDLKNKVRSVDKALCA